MENPTQPRPKHLQDPIKEPPTEEIQAPGVDRAIDPKPKETPREVIIPDANPGLDGFK